MRKHSAHPIDLFEGGAASDFTNAQLSKIFHTEPMPYLTTEGNKVQYLKYSGTFNYGNKPSTPPKYVAPAVHNGVKNDFPMTTDSMNVGYLTTDGDMADIYKMTARNIVDPEKAIVFQKPPKIEELKEEFGNLEELIKRSLGEKEAARADLLRTALLTMGLTPEEVRKAEVDQRIAEVMRARATGRLGALLEFPPAPIAPIGAAAGVEETKVDLPTFTPPVPAVFSRLGGAGAGAVPGGTVFAGVGDGTGAGAAEKPKDLPMGGAGAPMGDDGAPMGGAGVPGSAGRPPVLPSMNAEQRRRYDNEMARLRRVEKSLSDTERRQRALEKAFR